MHTAYERPFYNRFLFFFFLKKNLLSSHPMGVSKTEYLTLILILGCLTRSLGVNEGHQLEGKVNCPRQVPSLPLSFSEHIWLLSSLFSWSSEAVSWMQIVELWCCCPTTLWWFPVWKSTRKTGWSLGTYKTSWCTIILELFYYVLLLNSEKTNFFVLLQNSIYRVPFCKFNKVGN